MYKIKINLIYRSGKRSTQYDKQRHEFKAYSKALLAYQKAIHEGIDAIFMHDGAVQVELLSRTGAKLFRFECAAFENKATAARTKVRQLTKQTRPITKKQIA